MIPSGKLTQLLKITIEIVNFPMKNVKNCDVAVRYVYVYQRVKKELSFHGKFTGTLFSMVDT